MGRRCGILCTLVISLVAIFTMQTTQVVSFSVETSQAGREAVGDNVEKLLNESDCRSCHAIDRKVVGPSYNDVAKRYAAQANAPEELARSIRQGGSGNWGDLSMPAHPDLKDAQLAEIVQWIVSLKEGGSGPQQEAKTKEYTYTVNDKTVTEDSSVYVEGSDQTGTKV